LREREKAQKEELAQQQYARKIAEEAERTELTERMIQQMEHEEQELIDRLKKTQDMQREVGYFSSVHVVFTAGSDRFFYRRTKSFRNLLMCDIPI